MAKYRPKVPTETKQTLIDEAGGKCANPGCPNRLVELHHIKEWHVYRSHDKAHMIALCPSCHAQHHRHALGLTDKVLYAWKGAKRTTKRIVDHLHIDPAERFLFSLGTVGFGLKDTQVFELANGGGLSLKIRDGDLYFVNLVIVSASGAEVLKIVENTIVYDGVDPLKYDRRAGRFVVTAPIMDDYIPDWALKVVRRMEPSYGSGATVPLLDLTVQEPGHVTCEGLWASNEGVIVATDTTLLVARPPDKINGFKQFSVDYSGPIGPPLFSFINNNAMFRLQ